MSKLGYVFVISGTLLTAVLYAALWHVPFGENSEYDFIRASCFMSVASLSGSLWVLWGARRMPLESSIEASRERVAAWRRDRVFNYGFGVIVLIFCAFCVVVSLVSYLTQRVSSGAVDVTAVWRFRGMFFASYLSWGLLMFGGALIAWKSRWHVLGLQVGGRALLAGEVACARFPVTDRAFRAHLSCKYAVLGVSLFLSLFLGSILVPMETGEGLYFLIWMPGYLLLWLFRRSLFIEPYSGVALDVLLLGWPLLALALFFGTVTFGA